MINKSWVLLAFIALMLLVMIGKWGFTNQIDPTWTATEKLVTSSFVLIDDAKEDINSLFKEIHKTHNLDSISGYALISNPFSPTKLFNEWKELTNRIIEKRSIVFSSVSGIGSSTAMDRMTLFLAGDESRIRKIKCAPNFDLLLHKEYIGEYTNGKFIKGKLLDFFQKYEESPELPFVILIDDLNKINPESFWGPHLWDIL